jgi:hypothetical protein
MNEYVCIYASGMFVRDTCKILIEKNLVIHVDILEVFPMFIKKGKAKIRNGNAVMILANKINLEEIMNDLQSYNQINEPIYAYAFPVIKTTSQIN